ncbi:MAG: hypothetical protein IJK20_02175 [Bacteroidales bacterium]|nr:hypothetical protein [Bacteroidales bacterium]
MKKFTVIVMMACMAMFAVSCKNQPKAAAEEVKCEKCAEGNCKDGECKGDCENHKSVEDAAKDAANDVAKTAIEKAAEEAKAAINK